MRQYILKIACLFFIGLAVFLLGCKKAEDYLEQAKEKEDAHNWEAAINFYQKILERFPDYKDRDKVYFVLGRLYLEKYENDSLAEDMYKKGIQSCQCDSIIDSLKLAEGFYGLGKVYERPRIAAVKPLAADSLHKKVVKIGEKAEILLGHTFEGYLDMKKAKILKDSALVRIKFLNKRVKLPVGNVYKCEICGKFLKADKVFKIKQKYKHLYLEKYPTQETKKGRCYDHQIVKVRVKQKVVCPECGKRMRTKTKYVSCMRSERKNVEKTEKVKSEKMCSYCAAHRPTFGHIAKADTYEEASRMFRNYRPKNNFTIIGNIKIWFGGCADTPYSRLIAHGWTYEPLGNGVYRFTFRWTISMLTGSIDKEAIWELDIYERTVCPLNDEAEGLMY